MYFIALNVGGMSGLFDIFSFFFKFGHERVIDEPQKATI